MIAARAGNAATVKLLLAYGADPNAAEGWRGQTALMWAAAENQRRSGQDADRGRRRSLRHRRRRWFTPLLFAVRAGHLEMVRRRCSQAGANVNETLKDGTSALTIAALNAHWELGVAAARVGRRCQRRRAGLGAAASGRAHAQPASRQRRAAADSDRHDGLARFRPRAARARRRREPAHAPQSDRRIPSVDSPRRRDGVLPRGEGRRRAVDAAAGRASGADPNIPDQSARHARWPPRPASASARGRVRAPKPRRSRR